jgi:hypothetical protein
MKLLVEGAKPKDQINFKLEQDGNEVSILADGNIVAYFSIYNNKVSLDVIGLTTKQQEVFNTDDEGFLEVKM